MLSNAIFRRLEQFGREALLSLHGSGRHRTLEELGRIDCDRLLMVGVTLDVAIATIRQGRTISAAKLMAAGFWMFSAVSA